MRVELLPDLVPDVENLLKRCLAQEVELYLLNAEGKKCDLCPFRAFSRVGRVQGHLKYHNVKNMYVASLRSPQLNVIRALFDHRRTLTCLDSIELLSLENLIFIIVFFFLPVIKAFTMFAEK